MRTRTITIGAFVALTLALVGCQSSKEDLIDRSFYKCCVTEYITNPSFVAQFNPEGIIQSSHPEGDFVAFTCEAVPGSHSTVSYDDEGIDRKRGLYYSLSKRYNDLSYNDYYMTTPVMAIALSEPLSQFRCFEVTTSGEEVDISDRLYATTHSFLPFIESGYDKTLPGRDTKNNYVTSTKLVSELTEKNLTLLTCYWIPAVILRAKAPYRLPNTLLIHTSYKGEKIELTVQRPEEK